jgi:hypothetical protein
MLQHSAKSPVCPNDLTTAESAQSDYFKQIHGRSAQETLTLCGLICRHAGKENRPDRVCKQDPDSTLSGKNDQEHRMNLNSPSVTSHSRENPWVQTVAFSVCTLYNLSRQENPPFCKVYTTLSYILDLELTITG